MAWITFTILALLASVEAGLAYMREILMQDELATSALLRGEAAAGASSSALWITTAAQMGMGFILPFALTFVAIPLESFIHSLRTVLGLVGMVALRTLELLLRLGGNLFRQGGHLLVNLYDLAIFAPLWVEARIAGLQSRRDTAARDGGRREAAVEADADEPAAGEPVALGTS